MNEKICDKVEEKLRSFGVQEIYRDLEFHEFLIVSFSQFKINT